MFQKSKKVIQVWQETLWHAEFSRVFLCDKPNWNNNYSENQEKELKTNPDWQSTQKYFIQNLRPLLLHTQWGDRNGRGWMQSPWKHISTPPRAQVGQTVMWGGENGQWRLIVEKWKGTWEQWEQIKARHHKDIYEKKMWQNKLHLHLPLNTSVQLDQHQLVLALCVCWYDIKHSKRCLRNGKILEFV